jgi:ferredoxin-nitrate reductase
VFVPIHWGALWAEDADANAMTHGMACPDSKQPELKACAVSVELVAQTLDRPGAQPGMSLLGRFLNGLRQPL